MSSNIRRGKYSRRDFLFGLVNRFRSDQYWAEATGFDPSSQDVDPLIREGDYSAAIHSLKQRLEKTPDNVQARQKLAYCHLQENELEESIRQFREILKQKQQDNFTLLYLGLALAKHGNTEQATLCWREYFNVNHPVIQREINLQLSLYDTGAARNKDMVNGIEEAIREQARIKGGK